MADDLFGWPGDGLHWAWQRCGRYEYRKVLMLEPRPPGSQRAVSDERAALRIVAPYLAGRPRR
jgi:hypothetical protein